MGDEEIFKSLPADERKALLVKKDDFAAKAGNRKQRQSSYESRDL